MAWGAWFRSNQATSQGGHVWTDGTHPEPPQQQSNAAAHQALPGDAMTGHSSQI